MSNNYFTCYKCKSDFEYCDGYEIAEGFCCRDCFYKIVQTGHEDFNSIINLRNRGIKH